MTPDQLARMRLLEAAVIAAIKGGDVPTFLHSAMRSYVNEEGMVILLHTLFAQAGQLGGIGRVAKMAGMLRDIGAQHNLGKEVESCILRVSRELTNMILSTAQASVNNMCAALDVPVELVVEEELPAWAHQTSEVMH